MRRAAKMLTPMLISTASMASRRAVRCISIDAAIGFAPRLLHDDRPVQRRHRTVGAEHLDVFGADCRP